ncbi:PREDICTED: probable polygalacturonase At1g80170 isoform X2 [Tarenaya hassleriana]|uniref:probable polygalacturonase At1g80170 isoform X2 n=1 Tax=Tarenaya hassleriana TaxID=28532 RepID=UPI00053C8D76|nr:PREDICTED: probable polygalacturonase At1g80170 isoform X2 [Tarenaya hassleriana]
MNRGEGGGHKPPQFTASPSCPVQAFVDAWKRACSSTVKTRILVPENYTCLVRPVDFSGPCKAKLTLQVSGTIIAPKDPSAWEGLNPRKWLYFRGVNHLTVEGGGAVNGMGQEWWRRSCKVNESKPCRGAPTALTFHKCKDLRVRDLKVEDSQQMHMAFTSCYRVTLSDLKVIAPGSSPNTDGIHVSGSRGVVVKNALVRTGDDCVSIVNNSSKISISNIVCGPGHGISIGSLGKSESWVQVEDVIVDTAYLSDTENGVRIKTWQGGHGSVSRITFQNIFMKNVSNPIIIDQYYCDSKKPCVNQTSAVNVENISFIHIRGTSATEEAVTFSCSDDSPCRKIVMEDIMLISSNTGGDTRCFGWEAYGSCSGHVYPPCLSLESCFLLQKVQPNTLPVYV